MPRRNQGGQGRKGSSRSGGGRSSAGKDGARRKPPSRFDKDNPRASSAGRSFSKKRSDSVPNRGAGKPKPAGKPYRRSQTSAARPGTSKRTASSSSESEDRGGFAKKSRFAKNSLRSSPRSSPRSYPQTGADHRKERGASSGTPYKKKTYPPASGRKSTGGTRKRIHADTVSTAPKSDKVRLNKFIANSGISSRREADELIKMGLISVNGQVISELGYKVNPGDEVRYEDKVLRAEKPVYILMNKPKGFLTTTDDPQERKTVMHIIGTAVKERIYPVGRLDRNTTGLLMLTNDGELAGKLMHPSFNVKKVYKVELDRALAKADFQAISEGVHLEEGRAVVDDLAIVSDDGRTIGMELHIGWNRIVRRIFESLGYEVMKLDRTVYAGLDKKELGRGQWRFLSKEEIIHLKHFK